MSEILSNFMSSRLPISGLAAYSIHLPHQPPELECLSKSIYPSSTGQMLTWLVESSQTLLPCGESPVQYCWTYEAHCVYVAGRPDGCCLAMLVENNPSVQVLRVKETLQGFLELDQI